MIFSDKDNLLKFLNPYLGISLDPLRIEVKNKEFFLQPLDYLVENIQFSDNQEVKSLSEQIIKQIAFLKGIKLCSIYSIYQARAKNKYRNISVPAFNFRTLTYESAQRLFKVAKKNKVALFIVELAASEIKYTNQSLEEYISVILAAALKQNFSGCLFFQGDHFSFKEMNYKKDPDKEMQRVKDLTLQAIKAGFYNIDIDASDLVDENCINPQELNASLSAEMTNFIRKVQPKDIMVNIGVEVSQIGGKDTSFKDIEMFMKVYQEKLSEFGLRDNQGTFKIGIQNRSAHGGIVLPDGSLKKIKIDFSFLRKLNALIQEKYKLAGVVQHGASTLENKVLKKFPKSQVIEVHLATRFQNLIFDSPYFPNSLREEIYQWLKENKKDEWSSEWTEKQFIYKMRKKALGHFKKQIRNIDDSAKEKILSSLEREFEFFFKSFNVNKSQELVSKYLL